MKKLLDSFTDERLKELSVEEDLYNYPPTQEELNSLARIALAAKRAEPVSLEFAIEKFKAYNIGFPVEKLKADFVISWCLTNLTPQLNSPEIPEGWKLVPNMPTLGMLSVLGLTGSFESMLGRYADMLAAATESNHD
ncbi:hypothetical protein [Yersinia mollaretii]|uniref:hypothetical protein n=1 Tax=Yersinia mollaretii TaxID=33060 RepID=UPI0005DF5F45|nr:hypothetical protein [Yersinia mollaretii]EKN3576284.1 hypothetical protein [Yersinia enterocolitica]EKN6407850.1 hypothetical protein [Yersinia enterocolitica]MDN0109408.1 hypothetical protein [Yersinia mollaretii]CNL31618.1 Uncharacterised protein [Yersinia enterocolitica]HDL6593575.1 hypothetical protein [Yersinia enterocolitica]